jgi:hypothetical protein
VAHSLQPCRCAAHRRCRQRAVIANPRPCRSCDCRLLAHPHVDFHHCVPRPRLGRLLLRGSHRISRPHDGSSRHLGRTDAPWGREEIGSGSNRGRYNIGQLGFEA